MIKFTFLDYQEVRIWMYRNARNIELTLWQYHFENGSKEAVIEALTYYQNEDGGFGNALEADCWNPNSSPYTTLVAINILKDIDFNDKSHPLIQGIFNYIESTPFFFEDGWYFNIPSNNDYPHAPWWAYSKDVNVVESIGVTTGLISFILRNGNECSDIYNKALLLTDVIIHSLLNSGKHGDMGIGGYCELVESLEKSKLTTRYDNCLITEKLGKLVHESIEKDMSKWVNYTVRPSDYIDSPSHRFYEDNKNIISLELDYIIETRPKNGVWDITWSWFDNYEKYPKEFAISENWWKAVKAIEKIRFLKSFNRIEL